MEQQDKRKVALVTGASRGIGAGIARRLAADGFAVIINYRSRADEAEAVVTSIREAGGEAEAIAADVSDEAAAAGLVDAAQRRWGRLDVVVNNAGAIAWAPADAAERSSFDQLMAVNLWGPMVICREALRHLQRGGRIVNISSTAASQGLAMCSLYSATKGGLEAYTRSLAAEVARRGITVNAVAAGFIDTDMTSGTPEEQRAMVVAMIPLGRAGLPRDVGGAVAWLASDDAAWVTGQVIGVNGGMGA